ncbi:MAG: long-chain fatty acid--CoA ligase [Actinomycetota bacterium]|nr:long-chain fatty acid--CoA ligase [Actinomycetota bacterium]
MQRDVPTPEVRGAEERLTNLVEPVYRNARRWGEKAALGEKVGDRWGTISYAGLYERIRNVAAGLAALGVGRGARVGLMSGNRPEWPISDLAIQSLGAINVPIYPTLEASQVAHIVEDSEVHVVIVENRNVLDRVMEVRERVPGLRHLVVVEGGAEAGEGGVRTFASVEEAGAREPLPDWEEGWRSLGWEDVATIIYTSGTTGLPKGAVLTHGNILANLEGILDALPLRSDDVFLSLLPLSHVFERTGGQYTALALGASIYYAESIEKVPENLREVRPTVVPSVPRLYEKMYNRVLSRLAEGPALRRRLFEAAITAGKRRYEIEKSGGIVGRGLALRLRLYDQLVFGKLREVVGGKLRFFVAGGARLNPEIGEFFYAAGIRIVEGYGLTETSPVVSCNRLGRLRFGTVGEPLSNVEVRISEQGEILVRGPSVMRGYLNNERANAEAFTGDGYFRTGDIGEFDEEGCLKITDRAKNLIVLSTGKNVAPQPIETALVARPHISQSVLVGDGRQYVSALIVPDYEAVRKTLGTDAPDERLSEDERVRALIWEDIEAATKDFASYERPKRFVLLKREFSEAEGELTPTLKVKMRVVREHYGAAIESLYF